MWFHGIWIGISNSQQVELNEFWWDKCNEWSNLKQSHLEIVALINDDINKYHDMIESFIPLYSFGFKAIDYIILTKFWYKVKEAIIENIGNLNSIIIWVEYLRQCNRVPFNIKKMINEILEETKKVSIFNPKWKELKMIADMDPLEPLVSCDYNVSSIFIISLNKINNLKI